MLQLEQSAAYGILQVIIRGLVWGGEEEENTLVLEGSSIHFLKMQCDDGTCRVKAPGLPPDCCLHVSSLSACRREPPPFLPRWEAPRRCRAAPRRTQTTTPSVSFSSHSAGLGNILLHKVLLCIKVHSLGFGHHTRSRSWEGFSLPYSIF